MFTKGMNVDSLTYAGIIAGVMFFLPEIVVRLITKRRQDNHLLRIARRARPDGGVRGGWFGPRPGDAEGGRGDEEKLSQSSPRNSASVIYRFRWVGPATTYCTIWAADRGRRSEGLAAILIQADKFGSSVAQALRVQSDSMRTRRSQIAEEKAAKTAVKLIFPLVLFIFPGDLSSCLSVRLLSR